jgi:ribosomal protein S18 acetylase RimI-like enzyme
MFEFKSKKGRAFVLDKLGKEHKDDFIKFNLSLGKLDKTYYSPFTFDLDNTEMFFANCLNNNFLCIVMSSNYMHIIVGYVWCEIKNGRIGICVSEKFRNEGIGKMMLLKILDIVKHVYKRKVCFLTVQVENKIAVEFYKKVGFKIMETNPRKKDNLLTHLMEIDLHEYSIRELLRKNQFRGNCNDGEDNQRDDAS